MSDKLPHTQEIDALLAEGKVEEAKIVHNANVEAEIARAQAGATINLTDLMASKEQIVAKELKRDA